MIRGVPRTIFLGQTEVLPKKRVAELVVVGAGSTVVVAMIVLKKQKRDG